LECVWDLPTKIAGKKYWQFYWQERGSEFPNFAHAPLEIVGRGGIPSSAPTENYWQFYWQSVRFYL
jgi:hypothetical protein